VAAIAVVAALPGAAFAQPAIGGVVRDVSGVPRADVIVQASSPVLIEKVRTTTTGGNGRYRIENLPPGLYSVRFTLAGFAPYQRDAVEVTGALTTAVDAELGVQNVTETTTVAGAVPLVDVYSANHEIALGSTLVKALPTARSYNALLFIVPGVTTNTIDTVTGTALTSFPVHGGRTNEGRLAVDGWTIGSPPSGNSPTNYSVDIGNAVEVSMSAAGLGERETAGVLMNVVTQSGGNAYHGSLYAAGTARALQSDNVTAMQQAQGASAVTPLSKVYDLSGTFGGAISRDHLWYAITGHTGGSTREVPNVYYNLNAGDPAKWLYAPDTGRHEYSDRTFENLSGRVTWQVTPRNKVTGYWDPQSVCRSCTGATPGASEPATISPEAVGVLGRTLNVTQAAWTSVVSPRVTVEAGYGGTFFGVGNFERNPNPTVDLIRVVEQCASGCANNGGIPGLVYRSQDFSDAHTGSYLWKASASYVSGTTSLKVGYQHSLMTDDRTWFTNQQNLTYRVSNGVPNQLTESISPWVNDARAGWDAVYAQVQRTTARLTMQGALRFDRAASWFPEQQEGPSRFLPSAIVIPATKGVDSYKDITPRLGAALDLLGDGRTVLKANLGKYLEGVGVSGNYANTNPSLRMPQTTSVFGTAGVTRAWIDANGNFVPDCDLLNPAAQDLRASGGDMCGVVSNTNFGTSVLTNNFDSGLLNGWGVRPSDWTMGVSLEHRVGQRAALSVAYTHRTFHGFSVADNQAVTAADFTPFSLVAPTDPRLPGGGGYVIPGLYDVAPDKAGRVSNVITDSGHYGAWTQYFNGLDASFDVRSGPLTLSAGMSTGQTVADNCDVRARLPELSTATTGTSTFGAGLANSAVTPVSPYCHAATGALTFGRGLASYLVPRVDVQLSAVFQSRPGAMLAANYAAPNAVVAPSLGRDLSGNAPNVTVNLIAPGTLYGDRVQELDFRAGKRLKVGRVKTLVSVDIYNVPNASAVLSYNTTFVPNGTWLQPLVVQTPRFIRFAAEIVF
jgi:hypothetical protein